MALITHELPSITLLVFMVISPSATAPYLDLMESDTPPEPCTPKAYGIGNGRISDSQLTASTIYSNSLSQLHGRLNSASSWTPRRKDKNRWIQVDLGKLQNVQEIGTQGRHDADQWVKSYSVSYSTDGTNFKFYEENGAVKIFNGNYDRDTIVRNTLTPAVTARYIRIYPKTCLAHQSMRFEIYGCSAGSCKAGEVAFGMKNGRIHDAQVTASSFWSAALATRRGRMNGVRSWSAKANNINQWIQVDLGADEVVTAIGTQGRSNYNQWVKTYTMSYSLDGKTFASYKKVFNGNTDRFSIVTNVLSPTITARYIRIHPQSWLGHISMRLEVYGCYTGPCKSGEEALGVERRKISDSQLTASSIWNAALSQLNCRLNSATSWTPRAQDQNQWIQVDIGKEKVVTAIATQGRKNTNQWVKTYAVSYSLDGKAFEFYKIGDVEKVFTGNTDRSTIVTNVLSPPVTARYIRIHPRSFYSYMSIRIELYGCYSAPPRRCELGEAALGVESGKIKDSQLTASTFFNTALSPQKCRLYTARSWSARKNDKNQWLQVDLGTLESIQAIGTQGRGNANQWVKSYTLSYSRDGVDFQPYRENMVFNGNWNRNSVVKNRLPQQVTARYIRIHPQSWNRHMSMRIEIYGCYREPEPCDSSPCKNNGECTNVDKTFTCKCRPYFIGLTCETELPNPCKPNPCKNSGECVVLGNRYACRCKPSFGGLHCEYGQTVCWAQGDPHYTSFDGARFNFQGDCEYDFAKDCSDSKLFNVRTKNLRCGGRATCTAGVKIYIAGYAMSFSRAPRKAVVNGVKVTQFPFIRPGFKITYPSVKLMIFTADIGLTVQWDSTYNIKVTVSGRFKGKICPSSLCGNNNGNRRDDNQYSRSCAPPPSELSCVADSITQPIIDKCHLMNNPSSPFRRCNRLVDPLTLISDCKYDACRCANPMQCVCASFATYSKQCAEYGAVLEWRFAGTRLYEQLKQCEQKCKNQGETFTECGSSCAKTCRDLSSDTPCSENCAATCQCPKGQVLNDNNGCVPVTECTCLFQGAVYQPGQSIKVGNCKTCTCNAGSMACVDDRECGSKGPCESFPCKNQGVCTEAGDTFSCECSGDYQGKTCEDLKPNPCDSSPCKNGGICTNEGDSFSCKC